MAPSPLTVAPRFRGTQLVLTHVLGDFGVYLLFMRVVERQRRVDLGEGYVRPVFGRCETLGRDACLKTLMAIVSTPLRVPSIRGRPPRVPGVRTIRVPMSTAGLLMTGSVANG